MMKAKRFISAGLAALMVLLALPVFTVNAADTSPILWYDFEDGANDISGNGNDAMVNGAFITDSTAVFDGVDDYIKLPDAVLKNAASATVAIYLKPEIEKANQFTWCIGNTAETGYMFLNTYNPGSKLRAAITTGTYTDESALASDSYVRKGEWTSIIAVFDGENSVLYRDGEAVAAGDISIKPSDLGATTANYIAKSVYNDPYFKGTVSDFRIYDKALTAEEVRRISEEQKTSYAKTAPNITKATGEGIKSYGVEIDPLRKTIFIPVQVGTDIGRLSPQYECESAAVVTYISGTYADEVIINVADAEDPSLTANWTVTAGERGNAVLDGYYADPNIAVFNGKYYIYPTTDGGSGWDAPYFKCFSSDDLVHWKDEGVILDLKDVGWSNGYNGWAPTIAEKNGKYYFYYSAAPADNGAKNLAVAVADSPTGPFEDKGVIAKGGSYSGQMIDPAVFTDDDGQSYIYWGNGNTMHGAKLSDDMLSIEGDVKDYQPGNFREGSFMIKRNGVYYMMWSADDTGSPNYHVRYGTMDSPLGTLSGNTVLLHRDNAESNIIKGTGHHSVINIPGTDEWYICYHRFNTALYGGQETQSSAAGNHREVCIDKLEFDENGNIQPVIPTLEGITEPVYISAPDGTKQTIKALISKTSSYWNNYIKRYAQDTTLPECDQADGAYLFVHFIGSERTADSEQIYFSVSRDGQRWATLNDQRPVLTSVLGEGGVRDPHIIRSPEGDRFFLIATDLSIYNRGDDPNRWGTCQKAGSRAIMIWESDDLVNWSEQRMATVAAMDAGCTWAPESVYDYEKGQYMVFWASRVGSDNYSKQRIYRSYTTDFEHFTEPEVYIDGDGDSIDTTFINHNGVYYRFTKDESKKSVTMMQSTSLDGPFTDVATYTLNGRPGNTVEGYEGPTVYKINGSDKWCLLLDEYKGAGYRPFVTEDITKGEFSLGTALNSDTKYRHGTVIPITSDEYNALIAAYGN